VNGWIWRPILRNPPLCQLWQLTETGPGTYDICQLMDMHEAMDMENEEAARLEDATRPEE
jgi:DNA-binding HxlR family transcriptional regulator